MKTKTALWTGIGASVVFTLLIFWVASGLGSFRAALLPDQGPAWYYWKLPRPEVWATVTMWTLYAAHQILCWVFIAKLQKEKQQLMSDNIGKYNAALLITNGVFIVLHMLQTRLFYDGLAQFVPVFSSQYSVIGMLVLMLIMATPKRGLFFGKKIKFPQRAMTGISKTHGYYISWALVYTFWFHPMEDTAGHILGFFYMFLLMVQMSLPYTKAHMNMKWIAVLEGAVALHGTVVALQAGQTLWSMFLFGFTMMLVVTGLYGVVRFKWLRMAFTAVYIAAAALVYSGLLPGKDISQIHQIFWIPIILYGLVFVVVWLYQGAMTLFRKRSKPVAPAADSSVSA